ncbi:MAG: SDR family oxidoreductase [Bacillota bacterium]
MTILVTGATGTVGRQIVKQLIDKGEKVRSLSRNAENSKLPDGVQLVSGDLDRPETVLPHFIT